MIVQLTINVYIELKSNSVSVGGRAFANPTLTNPGMDLDITFQDTVMLDSEELEKALDHIEDNWRSANSETFLLPLECILNTLLLQSHLMM